MSEVNAQTLRILPLGNSITAGNMCMNGTISDCTPIGGHIAVGYRLRLLELLTAAGYNIDFVGTETYGNALMSDSDCGGFGGISDGRLADVMETGTSTHTGWVTSGPYMNSNPADVVLLHIGTNDILAADTSGNDVGRILDAIDDYETSHGTPVMVFLARIISTRGKPCNTDPRVKAYNRMMENLVASRKANGDQLILVDMECGAGLDYNNDMMDEVHPNQDGYDKMGQAWYNAIRSWMDPPVNTFTLIMENPAGSGSVSPSVGSHIYSEGASVSVSASPATGYEFSSWTGDLVSTENPASLTMNGNKSIRANFIPVNHSLSVQVQGQGSVVLDPDYETYPHNSMVSLSAIPESGYTFTRWTGDMEGNNNPASLIMDGEKNITANFSLNPYTLTLISDGTEGVELNPEGSIFVDHGVATTIEVTSIPADFNFDSWELISGSSVSINNTSEPLTSVSLKSGDATIRANFEQKIQVQAVSIANEAHIIGDTVKTEILVKDDGGSFFELESGRIGGYQLNQLQRIDSVSYVARFIVFEGGSDFRAEEDIPVTNLVLTNGLARNLPFSASIKQEHDPIDANAPEVLSMTVPSSVFMTGDTIALTIVADGEFYQAILGSSMNGVGLESGRLGFFEMGGGEYSLNYVVAMEDPAVASGQLEAKVVLQDMSGNLANPYTSIQENTLSIKIETATGADFLEKNPSFYPNPATDYMEFEAGDKQWSGSTMEIVDLDGRIRVSLKVPDGQLAFRVDISSLEAGAYLIRLIKGELPVWTGKMMKTN